MISVNSSRRRRRHGGNDENVPEKAKGAVEKANPIRRRKRGTRQHKLYDYTWRNLTLSSFRMRLFSMMLCGAFVSVLLLASILAGGTIWGGPGLDPEGGLFGRLIDNFVRSLRHAVGRPSANLYSSNITYPLLSQRNNRDKIILPSPFLDVILNVQNADNSLDAPPTKAEDNEHPMQRYDVSLIDQAPRAFEEFLSRGCRPSWLCHRCLALLSDPQSCPCPECYHDILCNRIHRLQYIKNSPIHVESAHVSAEDSIPRIIHQVGNIEWLDSTRFPDLVRLQNSWRSVHNSSYRYHTPEIGIEFVGRHFKSLEGSFLNLPLEQQRSLLGLLVLYHYGGVLANMDLLLEVNLDIIWENDPSFVASAVTPPSDGGCLLLWDGFVAAAAKHPTIGLAIVLMVEILTTHKSGGQNAGLLALWESASLCPPGPPLLAGDDQCLDKATSAVGRSMGDLSTNSYLLGKAYRETMWRRPNDVAGKGMFSLFGSHRTPEYGGTSHLLLMSRNDAGATRLTDVRTNTLVASTDLVGVSYLTTGPYQLRGKD